MVWQEQPEGYRPHPSNINGCCWSCGASQRDIRDESAPDGVRRERVFQIHRWLDADEPGAFQYIGMGKAGVLAICETCIVDVAHQLGMATATEHAEGRAALDKVRELLAQHDRVATELLQVKAKAREINDRLGERTEQLRLASEQVEAFREVARYDQEAAPALRQRVKELEEELAKAGRRIDSMQVLLDGYQSGIEQREPKRGPGRPRREPVA